MAVGERRPTMAPSTVKARIGRRPKAMAWSLAGTGLAGVLAIALLTVGVSSPAYATRIPKIKHPAPPTDVTVQLAGQSAEVSWGPPISDGGSPITGYSVSVGSGRRALSCTTTTATTCTVAGLMDGRQYSAKVRAVNSVGDSKAAASSPFTPGLSPNCGDLTAGADLEYCDFHDASFNGLDLAGADFWGAKLGGSTFTNTDLAGALFGGNTQAQSDLTEVDFSNDNMTGANLDETYLYNNGFWDTNLTDASFDGATVLVDSFTDVNLTGADLENANLLQFLEFSDSICPDGTSSDNDGGTCVGDLAT
jgi:Fibronectin type III domain/Pentapeptide repeats (9 copies)/Pentapeptide repeats (8 copies)